MKIQRKIDLVPINFIGIIVAFPKDQFEALLVSDIYLHCILTM